MKELQTQRKWKNCRIFIIMSEIRLGNDQTSNLSCIPFYREAGLGSLLSKWGKWLGVRKEERIWGSHNNIWMLEHNLYLAESSVLANMHGVTFTLMNKLWQDRRDTQSLLLLQSTVALIKAGTEGTFTCAVLGHQSGEGLNKKHMSSVRCCTQHRHLELIQGMSFSHIWNTPSASERDSF